MNTVKKRKILSIHLAITRVKHLYLIGIKQAKLTKHYLEEQIKVCLLQTNNRIIKITPQ